MKKFLLVAVVALFGATVATGVVGAVVPTAEQTTQYWYGSTTSNAWRLSGSWARRTHHYVEARGVCLPSTAQFQVANFVSNGATLLQLNTHRSPFGACAFACREIGRASCRERV